MPPKNSDYTTIANRFRMVSWSNTAILLVLARTQCEQIQRRTDGQTDDGQGDSYIPQILAYGV